VDIRLSEIISALSHALDVTEGQPMGHAERSCLIGLRLADAAGFDPALKSSLFYALLLKDAGCSATSATTTEVMGTDDIRAKRELRLLDSVKPSSSLRYLSRNLAPGAPLRDRVRHLRALVSFGADGARELAVMRCERGADIARSIDLDEDVARAIRELDEHWDGHGYPAGLAGEQISPLARVTCLAQAMELFWQQGGAEAACEIARSRSGSWFDPTLVQATRAFEHDAEFWASLAKPDVAAMEPADRVLRADNARLDRVAAAFASVVDAKSPYTASHSAGVAEIADGIAATVGLDAASRRLLRRAGLLHDVGKLGVSNGILDKPAGLTDEEWASVRRHPALSRVILDPVPALRDVARLAVEHHERMDGSGYPRGITATRLSLPSRILQVADVAEALSTQRPYREALSVDEVLAMMRADAGTKLDAGAFEALCAWLPHRGSLAAVAA
jgi:HD-GYP domain-containing protein (c-di-GMP phosphodiesterase class II)